MQTDKLKRKVNETVQRYRIADKHVSYCQVVDKLFVSQFPKLFASKNPKDLATYMNVKTFQIHSLLDSFSNLQ